MSKIKIFSLQHIYEYGEDDELEIKDLGLYSSRELAEKAIERYAVLEGFNRYPKKCFSIGECILDEDAAWTDGFMTPKEIYDYQKEHNICQGDEYKKSIYDDNL